MNSPCLGEGLEKHLGVFWISSPLWSRLLRGETSGLWDTGYGKSGCRNIGVTEKMLVVLLTFKQRNHRVEVKSVW